MASFKEAYKLTMTTEGAYVNNPHDKGGETFKGISRVYNGTWPGWVLIERYKRLPNFPDNLKESTSLDEHVYAFYKSNYWDINKLDQIKDQKIANEVFDTGVNLGVRIAAEFLQKSYNLLSRNNVSYMKITVDGTIGPKTIFAINNHPRPDRLLKVLNILQGCKYVNICERDPSQEEFFGGWIERVSI